VVSKMLPIVFCLVIVRVKQAFENLDGCAAIAGMGQVAIADQKVLVGMCHIAAAGITH
jgi:hypothetical protein